jgi:hypothetical protein
MPNSHPKLTAADRRQARIDAARCAGSRRHRLDPIGPPVGAPRPTFGAYLFERCIICGSIRLAHIAPHTGELLGPYRYDRPPEYQEVLREGRTPMEWRAMYWETLGSEYFLEPERAATVTNIKGRRKAS